MLGLLDKYQELYRKQGGMTFLFGTGMTLSLWSDIQFQDPTQLIFYVVYKVQTYLNHIWRAS